MNVYTIKRYPNTPKEITVTYDDPKDGFVLALGLLHECYTTDKPIPAILYHNGHEVGRVCCDEVPSWEMTLGPDPEDHRKYNHE